MADPATIARLPVLLNGTLTGASDTLFNAADMGGIQERAIFNPNAANAIWWSPFGAAVANAAGSFKLAAGEGVVLKLCNAITVIGTAADKVSAWER